MNFHDAMGEVNREDSGEPGLAMQELQRQYPATRQNGAMFSLESLWRAVGAPVGKGPTFWLEMAVPLLAGLAVYHQRLDAFKGLPADQRHEWTADDLLFRPETEPEPGSYWEAGDTMTLYHPAVAYARFLDGDDANG